MSLRMSSPLRRFNDSKEQLNVKQGVHNMNFVICSPLYCYHSNMESFENMDTVSIRRLQITPHVMLKFFFSFKFHL